MAPDDEPYTEEQLEELSKLAPRVDNPDAFERFRRAAHIIFNTPKADVDAAQQAERPKRDEPDGDCGDDKPPPAWGN